MYHIFYSPCRFVKLNPHKMADTMLGKYILESGNLIIAKLSALFKDPRNKEEEKCKRFTALS